MTPPPAPSADTLFWARMNSPSPHHDLPEMTRPTPSLPLFLLVSTPAGKPLLHLHHPPTNPLPQSLAPLSAVATAFQHLTHSHPREVCTPHGVLISLVQAPFHLHVSSPVPSVSPSLLRCLARIALAALHFTLSADFPCFIKAHPNAHLAHRLAPTHALLRAAVHDALAHPLPHLVLAPVSLPCPIAPASRAAVAHILREALLSWRHVLTHALIFTATPPYPRRLIATAASEHHELSPMDVLLLFNLAPLRADTRPQPPPRVYLQADDFAVASRVVMRAVQLRLDPDDFEPFKMAVGGARWRPEWNTAGGGVVWIMGLVRKSAQDGEEVGEKFLDFVEEALDRKSATRDLLVCMERPWKLEDMKLETHSKVRYAIQGVIVLSKDRISGTVGSFTHVLGVAVMETLFRWDRGDMSMSSRLVSRGEDWLVARFPAQKLVLVMWDRKYVVCFSDGVDEREGLEATGRLLVPWMKRFSDSIVPEYDRAVVPPEMLLPKFLNALVP